MTKEMALDDLEGGATVVARPQIDRVKVARYFFRSTLAQQFVITLVTVGFWSPVLLLWLLGLGRWYATRRAAELEYRLLPGRLLVRDGVLTKVRRTIPLDRITDLVLQQGFIERSFGLWRLGIQTASAGTAVPEGTIHGLVDPAAFRAVLLAERDRLLDGEDALALPAAKTPPSLAMSASVPPQASPIVDRGGNSRLDRIESLLAEIAVNTRKS
ncbi:MAG TPA: PH domain-containing protein [Nannocystis exedens]|nr:PH domain-containing protein [Nannocystis exedens]